MATQTRIRVSDLDCEKCGGVYRHAWDDAVPDNNATLTLLCTRCTSFRDDYYDRYGELRDRKYRYSKQYRSYLDNRGGKLPITELRVELVKRMKNGHAKANGNGRKK